MTYSDTDITIAIQAKTIIIRPYNALQLQTNSYDLCLGNTFYQVMILIKEHLPDVPNEMIGRALLHLYKKSRIALS